MSAMMPSGFRQLQPDLNSPAQVDQPLGLAPEGKDHFRLDREIFLQAAHR
jgi:hypothetical protein